MFSCLTEGIKGATIKPVNYDMVKEVTQGPDKTLALFLSKLLKAYRLYTNLGADSREGQSILVMHFLSQSALGTQHQLQKLEKGPQTPQ